MELADVLDKEAIVAPMVEFSIMDEIDVSELVALKGESAYRVGDGIERSRASWELVITLTWLNSEAISDGIDVISVSTLAGVGVWEREPCEEFEDIEIIDWLGLVALSFNDLKIPIFKTINI